VKSQSKFQSSEISGCIVGGRSPGNGVTKIKQRQDKPAVDWDLQQHQPTPKHLVERDTPAQPPRSNYSLYVSLLLLPASSSTSLSSRPAHSFNRHRVFDPVHFQLHRSDPSSTGTLQRIGTLDLFSNLLSPLRSSKSHSLRAAITSRSTVTAPHDHTRFSRLRNSFRQVSKNRESKQHPCPSSPKSLIEPPTVAMPSPTSPQTHTVAQFRALIWHSLDNGLLDTALFTAERLLAYDHKSADAAHLFALCLFRDAQYRQAEALTKNWLRHVGCAYIYAQCCLKLGGGKENSGISALEGCKRSWSSNNGWSE
jgi:hypothetical protein